jgi:ABC-2 type transport system permease protein
VIAGRKPLSTLGGHLRRMLAIARVESLHLVHDATSISLILIIPAVQIVLFGYAVNLTPKDIPIAISRGHGAVADEIRRTVEETGYFVIEADRLPPGGARKMVALGKALIGIDVPPLAGSPSDQVLPDPTIIVDASDPEAVRPALTALESAYLRRVAETFAIGPIPDANLVLLYNPMSKTAWAIVPGLAGVVVMITMLILGALTLVRERERGTWEALLAMPVDAADALAGKLSPYILVGIVQAAVVIWIARYLFDLPTRGNLGALLLAVPLFSAAHLVLGFTLSALANNQLQAVQGTVFFYLPSMLLSGFLFPFQGMPAWARTVGEALPLTHFLRATRDVLLKGDGAWLVASEMKPVAIFAVIASIGAVAAYRRRID